MTGVFLLVVIGVSATSLLLLLRQQVALVRRGEVAPVEPVSLPELVLRRIDWAYFHFALAFKQVVHYSYFYFLVTIRRVLVVVRFLLVRVERKCARLIDSVRGRGVLNKRGAVSLFLSEIKPHK